jgi:predicted TIM-barrel fold metal-dependent hydrolase
MPSRKFRIIDADGHVMEPAGMWEPDEPYIPHVLDFVGEDRLLFASDYPHPTTSGR